MKVTIAKSPGNAETIRVELEWDGSDAGWEHDVEPVLGRLDARMHAMNLRMLNGAERLRAIDPAAARAAESVLAMVNNVKLPSGDDH